MIAHSAPDNGADSEGKLACSKCSTRVPAGKFCINCGAPHAVVANSALTYETLIGQIRNRK